MFHISVEFPDLSALRVKVRVIQGGHSVPDEKIRERYNRNDPIISEAALKSDSAIIYDNSIIKRSPQRVLSFKDGKINYVAKSISTWARNAYLEDLRKLA